MRRRLIAIRTRQANIVRPRLRGEDCLSWTEEMEKRSRRLSLRAHAGKILLSRFSGRRRRSCLRKPFRPQVRAQPGQKTRGTISPHWLQFDPKGKALDPGADDRLSDGGKSRARGSLRVPKTSSHRCRVGDKRRRPSARSQNDRPTFLHTVHQRLGHRGLAIASIVLRFVFTVLGGEKLLEVHHRVGRKLWLRKVGWNIEAVAQPRAFHC